MSPIINSKCTTEFIFTTVFYYKQQCNIQKGLFHKSTTCLDILYKWHFITFQLQYFNIRLYGQIWLFGSAIQLIIFGRLFFYSAVQFRPSGPYPFDVGPLCEGLLGLPEIWLLFLQTFWQHCYQTLQICRVQETSNKNIYFSKYMKNTWKGLLYKCFQTKHYFILFYQLFES